MAHIELSNEAPGISGLMQAYPATAIHLRGLANALLHSPSSLTAGERELIAAFVSSGNACTFCMQSHAATARQHLGDESELVDMVLAGKASEALTPKLSALLNIAEKVRRDGRLVTSEDVTQAREAGADDKAIHDTVLIAAAFCMYNRYVDGLGTWAPNDEESYVMMGERLAANGY